jgi:hypothetical protein
MSATVLYGIMHDQITARIRIEYFTVDHPGIFGTDSPTLLGLSQRMAEAIPPRKHVPYLTDLWTYIGSHLADFLGGGVLAMVICVKRGKLYRAAALQRHSSASL